MDPIPLLMAAAALGKSTGSHADKLARLADLAERFAPGSNSEIWLADPLFELFERIAVGGGRSPEKTRVNMPRHNSFLGRIHDHTQPFHWRSSEGNDDTLTAADRERMPSVGSICCLPLLDSHIAEEPVGFLNLWTLGEFAPDLGQHLENLGLHVVEALRENRRRRAHEASLEIARAAESALTPSDFAEQLVARLLPQIFGCSAASLFLVNPAGDRLDLVASTGIENPTDQQTISYKKQEGLTGWSWTERQKLRLPCDTECPDARDRMLARYSPRPIDSLKSREKIPDGTWDQLFIVPLEHSGEVVGVLRLRGRAGNDRFSADDEILASELSEDLAGILVRQRRLERDRGWRSASVLLGEELQKESNEDTALRLLLAAVTSGKGLGFNRAAIWLSNAERTQLEPRLSIGELDFGHAHRLWESIGKMSLEATLVAARRPPSETSSSEEFRNATIVVASGDIDVMSRCLLGSPPLTPLRAQDIVEPLPSHEALRAVFQPKQFALAPLLGTEHAVGVLYVDNAFDSKRIVDTDVTHLHELAHLGGLALERIRKAKVSEIAVELHQRLAAAIVEGSDPEQTGDRLLEGLYSAFGFDRWLLFYHDQDTRLVSILGSRGFTDRPGMQLSFNTDSSAPALARWVVRKNEPHFTLAAEDDDLITAFWKEKLGLEGPLLAYPLAAMDTVIGVLIVNDRRLKRDDEGRLAPFVNHLATAVTTIVYKRRLRQRNELLKLIQETQTAFVHAFADETWFLHVLAVRLMGITHATRCAVYRITPRRGSQGQPTYSRIVALGHPDPEDSDERVPAKGEGLGLVNHVLAGETIVVPDIAKDVRWRGPVENGVTVIAAGEIRSFLGVPLQSRLADAPEPPVGAIALIRDRASEDDGLAFQKDDRVLVKSVATALSSFLSLKDAWRELDERNTALKGLRYFSQSLMPLTYEAQESSPALLKAIADRAIPMLRADLVVLYGYDAEKGTLTLPPTWAGTLRDRDSALQALCHAEAARALANGRTPIYVENIGGMHAADTSTENQMVGSLATAQEGLLAIAGLPLIGPIGVAPLGTATNVNAESGDLVGVMFVAYRTPHPFGTSPKLTIDTFASYAATVLHNARSVARVVLMRAQMQAREAEFEVFYGALAHRLRNALVTIPATLDLVLEGNSASTSLRPMLEDALDCARRAQRVVRDLERLSRSRSQLPMARTTAADLISGLERIVRTCLRDVDAILEVSGDPNLPDLDVNLDNLGDDFRNFANDSIRHRKQDRQLRLELRFDKPNPEETEGLGLMPGSYVKVIYADNGPGIPNENKANIFNSFYTTARGTGMGLSLAKQNAKSHGGLLRECGSPGKGVRFELFLRAKEKQSQ